MLNCVTVQGRLAADPELRTTQSGKSVASFRIACDRNMVDKSTGKRETDWLNVTAWSATADHVVKYFRKGSSIIVEGRLQTRSYQDKNGSNRVATEIVANSVYFCGGKSDSAQAGAPASAPQYAAAPAPPRVHSEPSVQSARPAVDAAPSYAAGGDDDFAVIEETEDLPF